MFHCKTTDGHDYGLINAKRSDDFAHENLRKGRYFAYGTEGFVAQVRTLTSAKRELDRAAKRGYTQLHVYYVCD